jgi:hypothetical protein
LCLLAIIVQCVIYGALVVPQGEKTPKNPLATFNPVKVHAIGGSSAPLTDYAIPSILKRAAGVDSGNTCCLDGAVRADWSDIRITDAKNQLLKYTIVDATTDAAIVRVKVPSIPIKGTKIKIY